MGIRFRCKNCNQKYELEDQWAGQVSECLRCGAAMQVPKESQIPQDNTASKKSKIIKRAMPVQGINVLDRIQKVQIISATAKSGAADDIIFRCKICQQKYRLPRDLAGQVAECAKCNRNMVVPVKSDAWGRNTNEQPEDNIVFWCKACGAKYRLEKELIGQRVECTRCKSTFPVPKESETAPPKNLFGQKPVNSKPAVPAKSAAPLDKVASTVTPNNSMSVPMSSKDAPESLFDQIPIKTTAALQHVPGKKSAEDTIAAANPDNKGEKTSDSIKVQRIEPEIEKTHTTIEMTKTVTLMVK
jgi:transcription initiation factor IIE alpha subunit